MNKKTNRNKKKVGLWIYTNDGGKAIRDRLARRLREWDIEVVYHFDLRNCYCLNGQVYTGGGENLSECDIFFHMSLDESNLVTCDMLQSLELSGVKLVNDFSSFSRGSDKYVANMLLRKNGVNVPPSVYIGRNYSRPLVARLFEEWKSVVVKPRNRWGGRGIIKFETGEHFNDYYWAVQHMCDHFYLEKFIPFETMDYRVEIIDGKRVGNPYSRQKGHSFITNIGPEGRGKPMISTVDDEAVALALRAAGIIGTTATIVDMIRSSEDGKLYVLEVNPVLGGFMGSFMSSDESRAPVPKDDEHAVFIENDRLKLEALAEYIKNAPGR